MTHAHTSEVLRMKVQQQGRKFIHPFIYLFTRHVSHQLLSPHLQKYQKPHVKAQSPFCALEKLIQDNLALQAFPFPKLEPTFTLFIGLRKCYCKTCCHQALSAAFCLTWLFSRHSDHRSKVGHPQRSSWDEKIPMHRPPLKKRNLSNGDSFVIFESSPLRQTWTLQNKEIPYLEKHCDDFLPRRASRHSLFCLQYQVGQRQTLGIWARTKFGNPSI